MSDYRPSFLSTAIIGAILTIVEIGSAAIMAFYMNGYVWPMAANFISVLVTIWFISYWTKVTIHQWQTGSDPTYRDPGVQLGARMSSRLSIVFFVAAEAYSVVSRGTVIPFTTLTALINR